MSIGPSVPAGRTVDAIAENIDLCPTFIQLAGADQLPNIDGSSLVALMHGQSAEGWRTVTLVEHHGPVRDLVDPDMPIARSGNPTTYQAIRSHTDLYVEYADGEREYHDLRSDPRRVTQHVLVALEQPEVGTPQNANRYGKLPQRKRMLDSPGWNPKIGVDQGKSNVR